MKPMSALVYMTAAIQNARMAERPNEDYWARILVWPEGLHGAPAPHSRGHFINTAMTCWDAAFRCGMVCC